MLTNTLLDYNGQLQLNLHYSWNFSNNSSFSLFPKRNLGQEEDETGEVISSPWVVFLFLLLLLWAETESPCSLTGFRLSYLNPWGFLSGSVNKESAAIQETQVWSLSQEDLLEKGLATNSSIVAWEIPWTEEPGGLQSIG